MTVERERADNRGLLSGQDEDKSVKSEGQESALAFTCRHAAQAFPLARVRPIAKKLPIVTFTTRSPQHVHCVTAYFYNSRHLDSKIDSVK